MRRFPAEFADLLSPRGRRLLDTGHLEPLGPAGRRFAVHRELISETKAAGCLEFLESTFPPLLRRMEEPIPPSATWGMRENYAELLPKSARVWTALLGSERAQAYRAAERVGLVRMLRSSSFLRLAELLNGRPLQQRWGIQLLCYGTGDYAGPHNDHHPEEPEGRDGYLDLHLTFSNASVRRQLLVYERRGHLSEVVDVRMRGGITAYRLPFWHYTTPLEARKGREAAARRWVLLGTFLDARPRARLRATPGRSPRA